MSKKKHKEMQLKEDAMKLAVEDIMSGRYKINKAAKHWGVPYTTLWYQMNGRKTHQEAHKSEQLLSDSKEFEILVWCHEMEHRFLPAQIPQHGTSDSEIGENWYQRFLIWHPDFKLTTKKRIAQQRVMARNPEYIMEFYIMLHNTLQKYGICIANIFNMDEKGFMLGITGLEMVVILTCDHCDGYARGSKDYGSRETITTIECICADGTVLPPMIIMKGKYVLSSWSENSPLLADTLWAVSESGWTDNKLGVEYIKAFDRWTADKALNGEWRCLILYRHGSHLTHEFLDYAFKAQIIVIGLPSHTTNFLQPLDRVVFRVLQRYYGQAVDEKLHQHLTVTKSNFAELLHKARTCAYTPELIKLSFESTGIHPYNPYWSDVMHESQAHAQQQHKGDESQSDCGSEVLANKDSTHLHQILVVEQCRAIACDDTASPSTLWEALDNVLEMYDGSKAWNVILEEEVQQLQHAHNKSKKPNPRRGQVGQASVYKQWEIESIRHAKESQTTTGQIRLSCGRGTQAHGCGRGCQTGATQRELPHTSIKPEIESALADLNLEAED